MNACVRADVIACARACVRAFSNCKRHRSQADLCSQTSLYIFQRDITASEESWRVYMKLDPTFFNFPLPLPAKQTTKNADSSVAGSVAPSRSEATQINQGISRAFSKNFNPMLNGS